MKRKLTAAFLTFSLALSMCACTQPKQAEQTTPAAQTGTATAKGFGGDVTVTLTVEDGMITEAVAAGEKETATIGGLAIEQLPAKMMETNTVNVDAIAGATVTSNAILAAAQDALSEMGLEASALKPVEVKAKDTTPLEDVTADVLVIGGGGAGMAAAVAAREEGRSVVLLEKLAMLGGNTAMSGGVFTRAAMEGDPEGAMTADELYDYYMTMTGGKPDPEVVRTYVDNSVDTQQWAYNMGSGVQETAKFHTNPDTIMAIQAVGKGTLTTKMAEEVYETGVDVRLNTAAIKLIVENGRVVGAIATTEDGRTQKFFGKGGVVLATGGFPAEPTLLKKYSSIGAERAGLYCITGTTGDGITMGEKVGAAIRFGEDWDSIGTSKVTSPSQPSDLLPALIVNDSGERFIDENGQLPHIYKEMLHQIAAGSDAFYYIFDSNTVGENPEQHVANGVICADTIEELAEKMGVPVDNLVKTVARYNEMTGKEDLDFGKKTEYLKGVSEAPFYAFTGWPYRTSTIGGLVIDKDARVLDENNQPIPGLYSAGEVANYSFFHTVYSTCGSAVGHAILFGRIAGTNAAQEVQ